MLNLKQEKDQKPHPVPWRAEIYRIVFGIDTRAGRLFDLGLVLAIICSILVVMLDSVALFRDRFAWHFLVLEWFFTIVFSFEYILRIISVQKPSGYIFSRLGVIDLVSIMPAYFSLVFAGSHSLIAIRALRLLRIFRILKLNHFLMEAEILTSALKNSKNKILVFIFTVISIATVMGSVMYFIEGEENGFTSIPRGMYWAIVTMTTVGYGDIAPKTVVGQLLASTLMIMGYGILAVPTGIFSAEIARESTREKKGKDCGRCGLDIHEADALYCKRCGKKL